MKQNNSKNTFLYCCKLVLAAGILSIAQKSLALDVQWLGASTLKIEDEKTRLIVDPFVSRPSWWKVLTNSTLKIDEAMVAEHFSSSTKETLILITHTHYDHVLDLPMVAKLNPKAKIIGPQNIVALAKRFNIADERLTVVNEDTQIKIGDFTIKAFDIKHSSLPFGIEFARGPIQNSKEKEMGAFDFKSQESLAFYFNHPESSILLHPSAEGREYKDIKEVDLLIVGLTSRDLSELTTKVIDKITAKKVMAVHHDNFFKGLNERPSKMPFYPTLEPFNYEKLPITLNLKNTLTPRKESL